MKLYIISTLFSAAFCFLFSEKLLMASDWQSENIGQIQTAEKEGIKTIDIPVSVYLLSFSDHDKLNAQYSPEEVIRLFDDVNAIWSNWGIACTVKTIEKIHLTEKDIRLPAKGFATRREFRDVMAAWIPEESIKRHWRVYIVRQFPVKGSAVYISEKQAILYGELHIYGERHPVILAHELGHSLGLRHVPFPQNLMYAGPDKNPDIPATLSPVQIRQARKQARIGPFQPQDWQLNQHRNTFFK